MIAIGIDPSVTSTGVVVLENYELKLSKAIVTKPVKTWREQVRREVDIANNINVVIGMFTPADTVIFYEDYAIGGGFASTIIPQVELGGIVRMFLAGRLDQGYEIHFVPPTKLKKFAAGRGNAHKIEVALALSNRFGENFGSQDDLWDAYGLARMALAYSGFYTSLTKDQIELAQRFAISEGTEKKAKKK